MAFTCAIQALAPPAQGSLSATTNDAGSLVMGMGKAAAALPWAEAAAAGGAWPHGGQVARSKLNSGLCYAAQQATPPDYSVYNTN